MFTRKKDTPAPLELAPLEQMRPTAPQQSAPQPPAQAQAQAAPAPQPQPQQPAPPPRPKPAAVLTQGLTIRGDVIGDVEAHLDCVVMGDVKVGKLMVGPNARIEGSVVAQVAEVHGLVIGSITAQAVRLYASCRVEGDITHEQLGMETGATFEGRSQKFRRPVVQPTPQPAPQAQAPVAPPVQVAAPTPAPAPAPQPEAPVVQAAPQGQPQATVQAAPQPQAMAQPAQPLQVEPFPAAQNPYMHAAQ